MSTFTICVEDMNGRRVPRETVDHFDRACAIADDYVRHWETATFVREPCPVVWVEDKQGKRIYFASLPEPCGSITYTSDAILDSKADALVVPVNTVGMMGAGLARAFARRWPALEQEYAIRCTKGSLQIGSLFFWKIPRQTQHGQDTPRYVVCLPTKRDWREPSRIEYIETGLQLFTQYYDAFEIESVSFPRLGCGLGGLAWEQVEPLIEKYLAGLPIPVQIHLA